MRKKLLNILVLLFYGLIVIIIMTGRGNLYGSSIDWVNQHSVFPEYFRNLFYETKRFLPNLALNIGAGQNIFNFAYYGFLSPIILLSYLMPFVSMTTFIISCSIILYLISAVLVYYFSIFLLLLN